MPTHHFEPYQKIKANSAPALQNQAPEAAAAQTTSYAPPAFTVPRAGSLLQLQRSYGNRHVQQVVERAAPVLQPTLLLGPANDRYEREADRVAQHVTSEVGGPAFGRE